MLEAVIAISALLIFGVTTYLIQRRTYEFLEKNMSAGGTPIQVIREQQAHQKEMAEIESERVRELRSIRGVAALSD